MKENSIEEDIRNAEHFIKSIKTNKEYKEENGWHGYYNKKIVEFARILQHILSDYKRVLEMNESWKSYSEELEEKNTEISNKKCELEFEVEKLQKENEELKKDYYNVINKIENKIDRFDYEFKKAKRQNNKDKSDYYWDLIKNLKKLLESEE